MAVLPPHVQTYHCICTSLLLATTHHLSDLPQRAPPSLDGAYILPLPSQPPSFTASRDASPAPRSRTRDEEEEEEVEEKMEVEDPASREREEKHMPPEGYSILLGMEKVTKPTIVRREDGFEKRLLWRCMRCRLVVGYEITGSEASGAIRTGAGGDGNEDKGEAFEGRLVYLLPNGILSTDVMAAGKRLTESEVGLGSGRGRIWE